MDLFKRKNLVDTNKKPTWNKSVFCGDPEGTWLEPTYGRIDWVAGITKNGSCLEI